jgi:K+-sensing histidine kinase KdpD
MELSYKIIKVLAHDLKGPAGNIKMFSEILNSSIEDLESGKILEDQQKEGLLSLSKNVESITSKYLHQIQNWVDTYALALGEYNFEPTSSDLNEIIDEAIDSQSRFIEKKKIQLQNMSSPHVMEAEQELLFRVFDVLLSVLIMFSPRNSTHYVQYGKKELLIGTFPKEEQQLLEEYLIQPSDVFDEKYYEQSIIKSSGLGLVFAHFALKIHQLSPELKKLESGDLMIKITGF